MPLRTLRRNNPTGSKLCKREQLCRSLCPSRAAVHSQTVAHQWQPQLLSSSCPVPCIKPVFPPRAANLHLCPCPPQCASEAKKPQLNIHIPSASQEEPGTDKPSLHQTCRGSHISYPVVRGHKQLFTDRYHTVSGTLPQNLSNPVN